MNVLELTEEEAFSVLAAIRTERDRVERFGPSEHGANLARVSEALAAAILAEIQK